MVIVAKVQIVMRLTKHFIMVLKDKILNSKTLIKPKIVRVS